MYPKGRPSHEGDLLLLDPDSIYFFSSARRRPSVQFRQVSIVFLWPHDDPHGIRIPMPGHPWVADRSVERFATANR